MGSLKRARYSRGRMPLFTGLPRVCSLGNSAWVGRCFGNTTNVLPGVLRNSYKLLSSSLKLLPKSAEPTPDELSSRLLEVQQRGKHSSCSNAPAVGANRVYFLY